MLKCGLPLENWGILNTERNARTHQRVFKGSFCSGSVSLVLHQTSDLTSALCSEVAGYLYTRTTRHTHQHGKRFIFSGKMTTHYNNYIPRSFLQFHNFEFRLLSLYTIPLIYLYLSWICMSNSFMKHCKLKTMQHKPRPKIRVKSDLH